MASGYGVLSDEDFGKPSAQILREHEATIRSWGSKLSQKTLMGHLKTAMGHRLNKQWMNQFKPPRRCETLDTLVEFDLWLKKMEISENISTRAKEVPPQPTPEAPATSTVKTEAVKPPAVPAERAATGVVGPDANGSPVPSAERGGLGEVTEAERMAYKNYWQTFKSPNPAQQRPSVPVAPSTTTTPTSEDLSSAVTPDDVRKKLDLSSPEGQP